MIVRFLVLVAGSYLVALLWQAFKVMGRGFSAAGKPFNASDSRRDRTGKVTIHPELLDGEGRLTEEDLLTVRFSDDDEDKPADRSSE